MAAISDSILALPRAGVRGEKPNKVWRTDEFYKEQTSKEKMCLLQSLRGKDSTNPGIKTNLSAKLIYELIERNGRKDEEAERLKETAKSLVSGGDGKYFLSAGATPGLVPARYTSFPKGFEGWSRVEENYSKAKKELDALDAEMRSIEQGIKEKTGQSFRETLLATHGPDASKVPIFAEGNSFHTSFKWGSVCDRKSSSQTDYAWPERDEVNLNFKKTSGQYGMMTKSCDTVEGNLFINPNAKKRLKSPKKG
jgi:hypothetical protein